MTSINSVAAISYGLGLLGFFGFSCQLALRYRSNWRLRALLIACVTSAVWQLAGLAVALWPSWGFSLAYELADASRYGAWLLVASLLLLKTDASNAAAAPWRHPRVWLIASATSILALATVIASVGGESNSSIAVPFAWVFGLWVAACVYGVVVCEQLFRSTPNARQWAIKPLCLALGATFGFDLFMFADAMMLRAVDQDLWSIRGLVHALTIPLIMVATARNRDWTIDVAVSRVVVIRSTALLLSGVYLLAVAGAGYYVRFFGGSWGKAVQSIFFFMAALLLVVLFSSGAIRSRLRVLISKHFFSYRYDYREEWLRFTNALAIPSVELGVAERSIKALADLVESPGGALWLRADDGSFGPVGCWNVAAIVHAEPASGSLAEFLRRTGWVINLAEQRVKPERYSGLVLPDWLVHTPACWLIVPLPAADALIGFVLLIEPRTPLEMNWEVLDLLKTAARQAASFLGHVRAAEDLLEAKQFDAFNRMSAFVVHDLKNLVAQLSLMLRNAERHASNPEFQKDMFLTIRHVADRMNRLLLQLRSGATPVENTQSVDVSHVVEHVGAGLRTEAHPIGLDVQPGLRAWGHEERLARVIGHLIQNAIDATGQGGEVLVRAFTESEHTIVEIADTGIGMSTEFVRERLFKPFQSTKPTGMGIGAYESRQYVVELRGRITVDSIPGTGTCVRVTLPAPPNEHAQPQSRQEAA